MNKKFLSKFLSKKFLPEVILHPKIEGCRA